MIILSLNFTSLMYVQICHVLVIVFHKYFDDWCRFVWDEAKYPTMSPLKEIVDGIHSQIVKIEDDLKVCWRV